MRVFYNKFNLRALSLILIFSVFLQLGNTPTAYGLSRKDRSAILKDYVYYDDVKTCDPATNTASSGGNKLYMVGDSLTFGMKALGNLQLKMQEKGWEVLDIEATPGDTVEKALPKVDSDQSLVKKANTVVVALGTNKEGGFSQKIDSMITKIRSYSPSAQILWMNAYTQRDNYDEVNATIEEKSNALSFRLIDWRSEFTSKPDLYPLSDGIHPTNSGYDAMAKFVVSSLGSAGSFSSASAPAAGSNTAQIEEYIFWWLINKGLTYEQTAGVIGNIWGESSMDPTLNQRGGSAYGLFQWDGGRRTGLENAARQKGVPVSDLQFQLDYAWEELQGPEKPAFEDLKKQTTVHDATYSFMKKFERPGEPRFPTRLKYANLAFQKFLGLTPPAGIAPPTGGTQVQTNPCPTGETSTGDSTGSIIGGFTVYSQYDPAWKDKPYGSSTIARSGCGPSSIAMVVTALNGTRVTPEDIASKYGSYYIPGQGSSWGLMSNVPKEYGLTSTDIGTDISQAVNALQSGGLVIATGQGPNPFTRGGHILVLRGVTANGKILVGDSGHRDTSDKEWEQSDLAGSINNMWVIRKQ